MRRFVELYVHQQYKTVEEHKSRHAANLHEHGKLRKHLDDLSEELNKGSETELVSQLTVAKIKEGFKKANNLKGDAVENAD